ncbi:hypothetical protein GUITHDRAFT_154261 [Guillardia theta CCMP2712]|uniref:Uncharacterized protein n=1 Tax=Guillardia theta (strain CCMP2712) TaxID=905079 RepID=L1IVP3_GUITC|nr:hypothetical protein GUITHDRAFT_154261 [Guillardia theta CCMP2712]EKX39910.1 hypothetical protein GUITHDRAFT_154261 [Guillardia theta CCMP2712]|eukprot:XP_005826890.1 hypothetical protein GUITHDRAFT_154261 [Guillardia theta CCMP2712]
MTAQSDFDVLAVSSPSFDDLDLVSLPHSMSSCSLSSCQSVDSDTTASSESSDESQEFYLTYTRPRQPKTVEVAMGSEAEGMELSRGWPTPSREKQLRALEHCIALLSRQDRPRITSAVGTILEM